MRVRTIRVKPRAMDSLRASVTMCRCRDLAANLMNAKAVPASEPRDVLPGSTCLTIRDLVTKLVAINYNTLSRRYSALNPTDIWNALQLIVSEQLGVAKSAVVPTARFVQDLGAE